MKKFKIKLACVLVATFLFSPTVFAQTGTPENPAVPEEVKTEEAAKPGNVAENEQPENLDNPEAEEEKNDNLFSTVRRGGWVMIPVLGLLLLGMTFIVDRAIYFYKHKVWKIQVFEEFLKDKSKNCKSKYKEELENELRDISQIYINNLEKGLNLIHGIGNLSPLLGFFGTVIGMIDAFAAIAAAATVNAKVVAQGIEIALVTTAGGLAVAVPMLAFYYIFSHFVQTHYNAADRVISELTTVAPSFSQMNQS
ncbi:MAG: MotA/TolQ/ExbB proton channel family protein [Leptospirales bacterium]